MQWNGSTTYDGSFGAQDATISDCDNMGPTYGNPEADRRGQRQNKIPRFHPYRMPQGPLQATSSSEIYSHQPRIVPGSSAWPGVPIQSAQADQLVASADAGMGYQLQPHHMHSNQTPYVESGQLPQAPAAMLGMPNLEAANSVSDPRRLQGSQLQIHDSAIHPPAPASWLDGSLGPRIQACPAQSMMSNASGQFALPHGGANYGPDHVPDDAGTQSARAWADQAALERTSPPYPTRLGLSPYGLLDQSGIYPPVDPSTILSMAQKFASDTYGALGSSQNDAYELTSSQPDPSCEPMLETHFWGGSLAGTANLDWVESEHPPIAADVEQQLLNLALLRGLEDCAPSHSRLAASAEEFQALALPQPASPSPAPTNQEHLQASGEASSPAETCVSYYHTNGISPAHSYTDLPSAATTPGAPAGHQETSKQKVYQPSLDAGPWPTRGEGPKPVPTTSAVHNQGPIRVPCKIVACGELMDPTSKLGTQNHLRTWHGEYYLTNGKISCQWKCLDGEPCGDNIRPQNYAGHLFTKHCRA